MQLTESVKVVTLLAPQALTATAYGAPLDLREVESDEAMIALAVGAVTGTNPTLDVKIQNSPALARGLNTIAVGATYTKLRIGATDNVELAATWTQSGARQIKKMSLFLKNNGTITAGKILTLTINADSTGDPGSVLGTSATVLCSDVPTAGGYVTFTFATPVNLADATAYHAVLTGDYTADATNNITWRSKTVASGGNQKIKDAAWAAVVATEAFEIYAEQYNFADASGYTIAQITSANQVKRLGIPHWAVGRHIRPVFTLAGTNPNFTVSCLALVHASRRPVAAQ